MLNYYDFLLLHIQVFFFSFFFFEASSRPDIVKEFFIHNFDFVLFPRKNFLRWNDLRRLQTIKKQYYIIVTCLEVIRLFDLCRLWWHRLLRKYSGWNLIMDKSLLANDSDGENWEMLKRNWKIFEVLKRCRDRRMMLMQF